MTNKRKPSEAALAAAELAARARNASNLQRVVDNHARMVGLVQGWKAAPSGTLLLVFDTEGEAINFRFLFHSWRKELAHDPSAREASEITMRKPRQDSDGNWFLELVRRGASIDEALAKAGIVIADPQGAAMHENAPVTIPKPERNDSEDDDEEDIYDKWHRGDS